MSFRTDVSISKNGFVLLNLTVNDHSSAPARQLFLSVPSVSYVQNLPLGTPAVQSKVYTGLVNLSLSQFGGGAHYLVINASNSIGSTVYNETLSIPVMCE